MAETSGTNLVKRQALATAVSHNLADYAKVFAPLIVSSNANLALTVNNYKNLTYTDLQPRVAELWDLVAGK